MAPQRDIQPTACLHPCLGQVTELIYEGLRPLRFTMAPVGLHTGEANESHLWSAVAHDLLCRTACSMFSMFRLD